MSTFVFCVCVCVNPLYLLCLLFVLDFDADMFIRIMELATVVTPVKQTELLLLFFVGFNVESAWFFCQVCFHIERISFDHMGKS